MSVSKWHSYGGMASLTVRSICMHASPYIQTHPFSCSSNQIILGRLFFYEHALIKIYRSIHLHVASRPKGNEFFSRVFFYLTLWRLRSFINVNVNTFHP